MTLFSGWKGCITDVYDGDSAFIEHDFVVLGEFLIFPRVQIRQAYHCTIYMLIKMGME
jgi:hypothetical protein